MRYVKKMCILRQIKQGFSGDGKTLSGLIKIEQYGKNLAVEVSVINFAPLASGEYYCLLSDGFGKTEMLSLRGKSIFNILSDIDISAGFCGIICYVKNEVVPIAYGIHGNGSYDWRAILNKALPPVFPTKKAASELVLTSAETKNEGGMSASNETPLPQPPENAERYDDEAVAEENYFEEKKNERLGTAKTDEDAHDSRAGKDEKTQEGSDIAKNGDASRVLPAPALDPDGYYLSVKGELDKLFSTYPQDITLSRAFQHSEWARVRGTAAKPEYLVGALYEEGKVRYICYALAAEDENNPPEEIKSVCTFVPVSPLLQAKGFFVIFQSAATGECVKPSRI